MTDKSKAPLTIREKLAIRFLMVLIQLIEPWEYSHQYTKFWEEIKALLNEKEGK